MSLKDAADYLRAKGRGKDTELVHLTKREVRAMEGLAKAAGGSLTRNPETGLPEAGFLDSLLPTILGTAANFIVPGSGMIVGGLTGAIQNKDNPLMGAALGAAGGYGGAQIGQGLSNMGQAAAVDSMITGAAQNTLPSAAQAAGQGLASAVTSPSTALSYLGGPMAAAKSAGLALAPALYGQMSTGDQGALPDEASAKGERYDYDAGYTGGEMTGPDVSSERRWFTPQYTRRYAEGGPTQAKTPTGAPAFNFNAAQGTFSPKMVAGSDAAPPVADMPIEGSWMTTNHPLLQALRSRIVARQQRGYADGGTVEMESGGFVIPADVVSMAGGGSTDAGLAALAQRVGARPIKGAGDGMSDDIPARIDGQPIAKVANGEAYVPRETVKRLGGARKLYKAMDNIRQQAHGKKKQQRPVDLKKAMA